MAVFNSINASSSKVKDFCLEALNNPDHQIGLSVSGVYVIFNKITMEAYIGQSKNIAKRWATHKSGLRSGTHPNKRLQAAWKNYGESVFVFCVFSLVNSDGLLELENSLISESAGQCYNFTETQRGQGRKSVQGAGKSPVLQVVVSPELKAKAERNGSQWVRDVLTRAKEVV